MRPSPIAALKRQLISLAAQMSQPSTVAEVSTGIEGRLVDLKETITSFKGIMNGDHDSLPESAFYMAGSIEDVKQKAEKLAKEMEGQ